MSSATWDLQTHGAIFGRTSSGKTYFFRKAIWERAHVRMLFFNTQHEHGFGREITHWDPRLIAKPGARVNYLPPLLSASENGMKAAKQQLARIADDLFAIGKRATRGATERTPTLVVVAVDEAHLISPIGSADDPLQRLATNGARFGIKFIAITQRPARLSHTVKTQATVHVLFDVDPMERPYLEGYAVPGDSIEWVSTSPPGAPPGTPNRRFAVRNGKVWTNCAPI